MRLLILLTLINLTNLSFGQVILSPLPDQAIGREGAFDSLKLGDFTTSDVFWEVSFLKPEIQDVKPTWAVNSSDFQFEMNITAAVVSKGAKAVGNSHLLAVTDIAGGVRSVGSAIQVQDEWVYFLTVYSNTNDEELFLNFYDDSLSQIIKGNKSFTFSSNSVLGEPDNPYSVSVSYFSFNLANDLLTFKVEDIGYLGSESLSVTARNLADPTDFAIDTLTLTVRDDYTPKLEGILDQVVNFGESFASFDLDDFTTLQDSDPVSFSFNGNTELQISVDVDNVVTITKPDNWSGIEAITFTVTDESDNAFNKSQVVTFTGKTQDQAPVITPIADQTTGIGGFFESIQLENFVTTSNPEAIKWKVEFITDSIVNSPDWTVNANEYQFNMSLTAKVTALGKLLSGSGHKLAAYSGVENKLAGITEAIEVNGDWFFFLTINSNTDKDSIYFKVYDQESSRILPTEAHLVFQANDIIGDPLEPFNIEAGYLLPNLNGNLLSFKLRQAAWDGKEILRLTAIDTATVEQLNHSDTIVFEVLNIKPPILDAIPAQSIEEGAVFSSINLMDFLKNASLEEVTFEIFGADTLKPAVSNGVLSFIIENSDYFGKETVSVKVISLANQDLVDVIEVSLEVKNINDAPVISTSPLNSADIGSPYNYSLIASDADFDVLKITVTNLPSWLFFVPSTLGATILGVPTEADAGEYNIIVDVSDGQKIVQQQISILVSLARIEAINAQVIDEGSSFVTIDLDDHLTVFGSISTYWEVVAGAELTSNLDVDNILTIQIPDENWFGKEDITVKLFDQSDNTQLDEFVITYEVLNINDAPEFLSNPSGEMSAKEQLNIKTLVLDVDNDQLSFSLVGAPDWIIILSEIDGFTLFGQPELIFQTYDFEVIANDGMTQIALPVQVVVSEILAIEEVKDVISLYPNPSQGSLNIDSKFPISEISILDQTGKLMMNFHHVQKSIDVSALDKGLYFLKIDNEQVIKFIKR